MTRTRWRAAGVAASPGGTPASAWRRGHVPHPRGADRAVPTRRRRRAARRRSCRRRARSGWPRSCSRAAGRSGLRGPSKATNAAATTTVGSTNGTSATALISRRPGKSNRANDVRAGQRHEHGQHRRDHRQPEREPGDIEHERLRQRSDERRARSKIAVRVRGRGPGSSRPGRRRTRSRNARGGAARSTRRTSTAGCALVEDDVSPLLDPAVAVGRNVGRDPAQSGLSQRRRSGRTRRAASPGRSPGRRTC